MEDVKEIYLKVMKNPEYVNHMSKVKSLGSQIMELLDSNKSLLIEFEKSVWLAEEICIEEALRRNSTKE